MIMHTNHRMRRLALSVVGVLALTASADAATSAAGRGATWSSRDTAREEIAKRDAGKSATASPGPQEADQRR